MQSKAAVKQKTQAANFTTKAALLNKFNLKTIVIPI